MLLRLVEILWARAEEILTFLELVLDTLLG
jgi:hypothetical protein